jgi:hypothetical protein
MKRALQTLITASYSADVLFKTFKAEMVFINMCGRRAIYPLCAPYKRGHAF